MAQMSGFQSILNFLTLLHGDDWFRVNWQYKNRLVYFCRAFKDKEAAARHIIEKMDTANVYVSVNSRKDNRVDGAYTPDDNIILKWIFADLDHGLPLEWHKQPDIILQTSTGHFQAFWKYTGEQVLRDWVREYYNTNKFYKADMWHMMPEKAKLCRVAGQLNYKRKETVLWLYPEQQ